MSDVLNMHAPLEPIETAIGLFVSGPQQQPWVNAPHTIMRNIWTTV